jgi:hypothetical protein
MNEGKSTRREAHCCEVVEVYIKSPSTRYRLINTFLLMYIVCREYVSYGGSDSKRVHGLYRRMLAYC